MILRSRLEAAAAARHWDLKVKERPTPPLMEAAISIRDWRITMSLQPEGPSRLAELLAVSAAEGDRLWDQMASAALRHEMGHWDYCPFSGEWNATILEGIGQALRNRPFRHKDAVVRRMANFFCDLIVNAALAARGQAAGQFAEGLATHLVKEWARAQAEGGLSKEYRLFLGASAHLLPHDGPMGRRLAGLVGEEKDGTVKRAVKKLVGAMLDELGASGLASTREEIAAILLQQDQWKGRARRVAEILARFVPRGPARWRMSADVIAVGFNSTPGAEDDIQVGGEAGKDGEDTEGTAGAGTSENGRGGEGAGEDEDTGAAGRGELESGEEKDESAEGEGAGGTGTLGGRRGRGAGGAGPKSPLPPFQAALEDLYRARAANIVLEFDRGNPAAQVYPVAHLRSRRLFEGEGVAASEIYWARTRFVPSGPSGEDVWLYRRELPHSVPLTSRGQHRLLPDLAFLVDSSRSMQWDPYAGTGKFDLVLRTVYSVFQWLAARRVAYYLNYAAINFSGQSYFSGWQSWYRLGAMKRVLLAYQGRGTVLDNEVVRDLRQQAHRPFAAIMITDGAIANADEVLLGMGEILREGHSLILIQIGGETPFAQGARALGAEVHLLDSAAGLPGLVLGRVRGQYGRRLGGPLVRRP